jgi:uncharacterized membrane protein YfcA
VSTLDYVVIALSGFAAGLINALAGGGTLVSFPALVALGIPAVSANVTNTVALVPGYLGGAWAQRRDLVTYLTRLRSLVVVAAAGGLLGSILLVNSSDDLFSGLVPILILVACALLGFQDLIRTQLVNRRARAAVNNAVNNPVSEAVDDAGTDSSEPRQADAHPTSTAMLCLLVGPAAIYGGYFGAGLGIMLLAVLGIALDDPLPRINSLKSALSLVINLVAAAFLAFSDYVVWDVAAVMAIASVVGGATGGRIAGKLDPKLLRIVVIAFGLIAAVKFML